VRAQRATRASCSSQDTSAADVFSEPPVSLAPRERQALALTAQGFTQAQAATQVGTSPATIDTSIKRVRRKLGRGTRPS
jgi:DNA-binding CsgD family transcriptional regulator